MTQINKKNDKQRKIKVLVFPAGTEIAFEILNALKYSKFIEIYGANSMPSHAEFVFERCITDLPLETDSSFLRSLNKLIDEEGIDFVYPARDSSCLLLTEKENEVHAKVVTSPLKTVEICRSKNKTYEYFKDQNFIPKTYKGTQDVENYPVFIKPAVGQGSVGARLVKTKEELIEALKSDNEYSICEYLPGEEYTVDCFTDKNQNLRVCKLRSRERIKTGIAVKSRNLPISGEVKRIAEEINFKLIFNGAWFFQLKKNAGGELKLLEISPRIPGTMSVSRNTGINFPLLTIYNMLGYDVDIINNDIEVLLDRAFISRFRTNVKYRCVYIDFDDTIYIGDKVNLTVISFLYQCVNNNIPIVLLTKHRKDILCSLEHFKISDKLFAEIINIDDNQEKFNYIKEKESIFIDDSFSERKKVKEKLGINVYDLDMIESLIDWRM